MSLGRPGPVKLRADRYRQEGAIKSLSQMTQRERLLAVFSGAEADRVPWVADITYWRDAQEHRGQLPSEYMGPDGYLQQHEDLGLAAYYNYTTNLFSHHYQGVEIDRVQEGRRRRTTWRVQEGSLSQQEQYLPASCCWALTEYPVRTPDDLRLLRAILRGRQTTSNSIAFLALDRSWGGLGYPSVLLPRSPLPALLVEWAGVENLAYLVADAPEEVQKTLEAIEEANRQAFRLCTEAQVPLVHFPDNLSSENSAGYFDRYMRPYYRQHLDELHEANIRAAVHLDGTVRALLPRLADVGFDAVESLTPAPVGDVGIEQIRSLARRVDVILWGGVPGAMFAPPFTKGALERHVKKVLACCGHTPFILGSADQVPPNGDILLCEMIAEIVQAFIP